MRLKRRVWEGNDVFVLLPTLRHIKACYVCIAEVNRNYCNVYGGVIND